MIEYPLFSSLVSERGDKISSWAFKSVNDNIRVYYKPLDPGNGFDFYVADWASSEHVYTDDWCKNSTTAQCLFHGIAYYDGVRHLYMGNEQTDNVGYLYYATPSELIEVFKILKDLEQEYCDSHG